MTGAGARIYDDGRFVLGKAAQNLTYDGSALYLNGFYANVNTFSSLSVIYSGAAVNFAIKDFTGIGEFVQATLQKPTVVGYLTGGVVVQLATATQSMLLIEVSLIISRWNGASWDIGVPIGGTSCTFVTGTDTGLPYPYKTPFSAPYTIPIFAAGTLYRVYPHVVVSCYRLNGSVFNNMSAIYWDGATHLSELKI
jgi:hypothetical protein